MVNLRLSYVQNISLDFYEPMSSLLKLTFRQVDRFCFMDAKKLGQKISYAGFIYDGFAFFLSMSMVTLGILLLYLLHVHFLSQVKFLVLM